MERFVAAFAERYLGAYRAWRAGRPISASWELAFDTASARLPVIVQHLVLGMNAHINFDLGIVVAELGRGAPAGIDALRSDFELINDVLAEETDDSQANVNRVSPLMRCFDGLGLRTDEQLCRFSLELARREAWNAARRHVAAEPAERAAEIERCDRSVARLGRRFADPGGLLDVARTIVRAGELRSVPSVIDALLR